MTNEVNEKKLVFFLNWLISQEVGLTGGDRIWIELSKRWKNLCDLTIVTSIEGIKIAEKNLPSGTRMIEASREIRSRNLISVSNLLKNTILRVIDGVLFLPKYVRKNKVDYLYSSSDFLADSFPAFVAKLLNPEIVWIAGFYLFAPLPWDKNSPYRGKSFFRGFVYWLEQRLPHFIINNFADFVFVTSVPDVKHFITKKRDKSRIVVVQGGVDVKESEKYLKGKVIPLEKRKYLACFVGRLHYQKGVLELIDIWKEVVEKKKDAKLAIVGNGVLKKEVIKKIKKCGLENNIDVLGFKDGREKYEIFKNSKIILHPAIFDSGGMAAAEGMAWGLPGVSFDLESLRDYYPRGMIKTPCFDLSKFAQNIIDLDRDQNLYRYLSQQAVDLIYSEWDWEKRAKSIFEKVFLTSMC